MKRSDITHLNCSVARALDVVGEWWSLLIIRNVAYGQHRFTDIAESLGVARNVLTDRLRTLVEADVLRRVPDPDDGRAARYELTDKGQELVPLLLMLMQWGDRWESPDGAPLNVVDSSGEVVDLALVSRRTGEEVDLATMRLRPGPGFRHEARGG
ncbi:winged helix-turn-helix transcriptional regulator [Euzebya tangerina]|uniref:winged helix-turn-helix transcriptional regulator n=1 Tax=Euzebya tangerina TaxID=591198 RepID=UPI0013C37286|nr:helix-turn-helix domain-containing protein [Euzebya tangerina]